MYYLIMLIHQDVEGKEYQQSTTPFDDFENAKTEWHIACASYRKKGTTIKCTAFVTNDNGRKLVEDIYTKPQPTVEETPEEASE